MYAPLAVGLADEGHWSSYDGSPLTAAAAEKVSAWFTCIKIISGTLAGLPKQLFRSTANDQRERVRGDPLSDTLDKQPGDYQTAFEFWEYMAEQVLGTGACFARPGNPAKGWYPLEPIPTARVTVKRNTSGGKIYEVRRGLTVEHYNPDELFRVLWFSPDGVSWKNPVAVMADQLSGADSANVYISRYFKNSALPSGVLETDKPRNELAAKELRTGWHGIHGGPENAGKTAVLWNGMRYKPLTPTMRDIEMTALQKASTAQIAAFFGVPLDMLGDMTGAKFANVEHKAIAFVQDTVLPWCRRIEAAISRDLILDPEQFVKFNIDGLLRADFQTRMAGYATAIGSTVLTPNEARKLENLPPREGGDDPLPPPNMSALPATNEEEPEEEEETKPPPDPEAGAYNHLLRSAAAKIAATDWKQTGVKGHVVKHLEPLYHLRVNDGRKPEAPSRVYERIAGLADADAVFAHLFRAYG